MRLSEKAKNELQEILSKEIGVDAANDFSSEELNELGLLLLNTLAENLKMKVAGPELPASVCE